MQQPDHVDRVQDQWRVERPDLDTSPLGLIGRLHRLGEVLYGELRRVFDEAGLTEGEFDVLASLRRAGAPYELGAGELGAATMVSSGAVTKRVDRLVAAGLVHRRTSEVDARARVVGLTPAGLELVDGLVERHLANEHRLVASLTSAQRAQLERLLRQWGRAFDL
ncbi:MarR family winged helix-turn-helix transcriptional regulator [Angustibacter aerolatus]